MRVTLELPDTLVEEAMTLTKIQTKTDVIKVALENLIQKEKIQEKMDPKLSNKKGRHF